MERQSQDAHHVLPNKNGGWDIKKTNAKRASRRFDTKKEAIEAARVMSKNEGTELIIHDKNDLEEIPETLAATKTKSTPPKTKPATPKPQLTPHTSTAKSAGLDILDVLLMIAVLLGVGLVVYFWYLGLFTVVE